ncbi:MAG TPA: archease [Actinomycetota bacterium]|jgi:SHS2 domain-containing protein|nr:archease [Actinomycetota bacterium]
MDPWEVGPGACATHNAVVQLGVWVVILSAIVGSATAFVLRTRIAGWAVAALLAGSGAALGWGGMLLRADPEAREIAVGVAAMAVLVPVHVRIVLGPFGPRRIRTVPRFEILEHTADVGLLGRGATLEEAFAGVAEGLATLLGLWFPGEGTDQRVHVEGRDLESVLAAWVDELLYLHEVQDVVFGGFTVQGVTDQGLDARVRTAARGDRELEGIGVKAATYHRLEVDRDADDSWFARIYLDV